MKIIILQMVLLSFGLASCSLSSEPVQERSKPNDANQNAATCLKSEEKPKFSATVCATLSMYACEVHRFSPELSNGQGHVEACTTEGTCRSVMEYRNSTAHLLESERAEFFMPGESYNRDEYFCVLNHYGLKEVRGEGDSLHSALKSAHQRCLTSMEEG